MKSNTLISYGAPVIAGLCLLLGSVANAAPADKTLICHKPGERNQRILNINLEKDGPKHLGHGDYEVLPEVCDGLDSDCEKPPVADNGVDCSDGIACTDDSCNGSLGCFNVPNDALCVDGPPNTEGTCSTTVGECVYTPIAFCGDGNTDQGEQCDDGNTTDGDGCSSTCATEAAGNVFVTSGTYTGDLVQEAINHAAGEPGGSGLDAGDALCNYHAQEDDSVADKTLTYAAWLSTTSVHARDRIADVEYRRVGDAMLIATGLTDLTDGDILSTISHTETGNGVTGTNTVWTGTLATGLAEQRTCEGWTTAAPPHTRTFGAIGSSDLANDAGWTVSGIRSCGGEGTHRLYCFPAANGD